MRSLAFTVSRSLKKLNIAYDKNPPILCADKEHQPSGSGFIVWLFFRGSA
jgi:hypothetical protein